MGGTIGKVFGSVDKNATNTVDGGGNVVATGTPGGSEVADPNKGLSSGQMFARRALAGGLRGGGSAMQQQGQPGRPGNPPVRFDTGQPQLSPDLTEPQGMGTPISILDPRRRRPMDDSMLYGG